MFCGYKHCATKELDFKKWNCLGHNIIFGGVGITIFIKKHKIFLKCLLIVARKQLFSMPK